MLKLSERSHKSDLQLNQTVMACVSNMLQSYIIIIIIIIITIIIIIYWFFFWRNHYFVTSPTAYLT
jgi:type II secretory pathway component PulF